MGADIHILLEKKVNEKRWEPTKERCKWKYQFFEQQLKRFTKNDEIMMETTLDGSLEEVKERIKEADSSSFWIEGSRDYLFFSVLSGVRNYNNLDYLIDKQIFEYNLQEDEATTTTGKIYSNFSEEAKEMLSYDNFVFHSQSIISGDEIDDIINLIEELESNDKINKEELAELTLYFEEKFEEPLKKYTDKGFHPSDLRFVLAYDN